MYPSTLILNTQTFEKKVQRPMSSVYIDTDQTLDNPRSLTISHEVAKSGRVSTAVMLDDTKSIVLANSIVADNTRVLIKLSYNPLGGRASLDTVVRAALADLVGFLSDTANIDKLLTQES